MIYFFSDSHIGSRAVENRQEHQQRVIRMLERMSKDATEIHILGDLFDFWYEYIWPDSSKREYDPIISCLKQLTDRGIRIHFYRGNHDIWTFYYFAKRTGVILHKQNRERATIGGKNIILGHGDGLVPEHYAEHFPTQMQKKIKGFIRLRKFFHCGLSQFLFALLPPRLANNFGYNWAKHSRLRELANPCGYKGEQEEELVLWAKEYEGNETGRVDYYIFGHRHIELDLLLHSGARVIILGDTFRQWTYAQMTEDGEVSLECYEE